MPDEVAIYDAQMHKVGSIEGFSDPEGMATDAGHNLYVADALTTAVSVYRRGGRQPFEHLTTHTGTPATSQWGTMAPCS